MELEAYFRDEGDQPAPLQIYCRWFDRYRSGQDPLWRAALQDFVMLPYVLIIVICLLAVRASY